MAHSKIAESPRVDSGAPGFRLSGSGYAGTRRLDLAQSSRARRDRARRMGRDGTQREEQGRGMRVSSPIAETRAGRDGA
jgi:hypothetical protein